ncbi:MAG: methyl-accepting chemotaxis protein, partial [bacterium]|nr:methyl-accepting chemotaxis protein [bacterium]
IKNQNSLVKAQNIRHDSYLRADELRQSSDDLTRLGRTYVVTGDERYEKMYMDVLAIRNGQIPRPELYERIYWDFVIDYGQKPRKDGPKIPLNEMMKQLGFTNEEFRKLEKAKANSDKLVHMEVKAMNAVKGIFANKAGKFTIKKEPDPTMARNLVHSIQYHQEKAKIMKPINEFFELLDQRTKENVDVYKKRSTTYLTFLISFIMLLIIATILCYFIINKQVSQPLTLLHQELLKLEKGESSFRVDYQSSNEVGALSDSINITLHSLSELLILVKTTSTHISDSSEEIKSNTENLAERTREQATSIMETSSTLKEFTTIVQQNTENSVEADSMLTEFNNNFHEINELIKNVTSTMTAIYDSSRQIDNIIKVINDISFQTNLLALNAAVEAARAGDAGRGFAVVAAEVRNLAQKTAESSRSIQQIVEKNVLSTHKGMKLVKDTSGSFEKIVTDMQRTVHKVNEITQASREQSTGIKQINTSIGYMNDSSNINAELVEQIAQISKSLKENAVELQRLVGRFKT